MKLGMKIGWMAAGILAVSTILTPSSVSAGFVTIDDFGTDYSESSNLGGVRTGANIDFENTEGGDGSDGVLKSSGDGTAVGDIGSEPGGGDGGSIGGGGGSDDGDFTFLSYEDITLDGLLTLRLTGLSASSTDTGDDSVTVIAQLFDTSGEIKLALNQARLGLNFGRFRRAGRGAPAARLGGYLSCR